MPPALLPTPNVGTADNFIACTLGTISFKNFECPNEQIDGFGGYISMARHKYAGGQITTQCFGWFPQDEIKWTAQFFQDPALDGTMYDRIAALERLAVLQQPVTLSVGQFQYSVMIQKFEPKFRLQFWIPYEISLVTVADLNPATFGGAGTGGPTNFSTDANNPNLVSNPTNNPTGGAPLPGTTATAGTLGPIAGGAQISNLANSNSQLTDALKNAGQYPALPPTLTSNLTQFQQSLNNAIQQALNNSLPVSAGALAAGISQAQDELAPLISGPDPGNAAFAAPVSSILGNVDSNLAPVSATQDVISAINPNLNRLSNFYYKDPTKWNVIAAANPGITTPTPIGSFPNLIIPKLSASSSLVATG